MRFTRRSLVWNIVNDHGFCMCGRDTQTWCDAFRIHRFRNADSIRLAVIEARSTLEQYVRRVDPGGRVGSR